MARTGTATGVIGGGVGGGSSTTDPPESGVMRAGTAGVAASGGGGGGGGAGAYAARKGDRVGSHGGASAPGVIGVALAIASGGPIGAAASLAFGLMGLSGARASSGCSTIKSGSPSVEVEGQPVARAGIDDNDHGQVRLDQGSAKVYVNGRPLVRVGDRSACTGVVTEGARKTRVGGPPTSSGAGAGGGTGAAASRGLLQLASVEVGRQLGENGTLTDVLPALPPAVARVAQVAQVAAPVVRAVSGVAPALTALGGLVPSAAQVSQAAARDLSTEPLVSKESHRC